MHLRITTMGSAPNATPLTTGTSITTDCAAAIDAMNPGKRGTTNQSSDYNPIILSTTSSRGDISI
jgi:hypothetical protein